MTGIRFALDPGAGRERGPGAFRDRRHCARDRRGHRHPHLRREPQASRVSSLALRVELDLRASAGQGNGDIPEHQVTQLLHHDHDVAAWSGVYFAALQLDGHLCP